VTYAASSPDTHFPPIRRLLPPEGAPNVLVVLIDDVGFGASSAFGGLVETPSFERLARDGLKYTLPYLFSFDETVDVGLETGSPVSPDYPVADNRFNGTIDWVRIDLGNDSHDHLADPDHHLHIAMTRQ